VLHSGVRSITDLMVLPGLINLDFADVRTVMTEMGKAMMGTGEATGEGRALMAAENAIQNPLLDEVTLKGAKAVLVNITGGLDMTLLEVDEAANAISAQVDPEANIIFGAAFDPTLVNTLRVSVVATGMDGASISAIEPAPRRTSRRSETAPAMAAPEPYYEPAPMPQPVLTFESEFAEEPAYEPAMAYQSEPEPAYEPVAQPAPVQPLQTAVFEPLRAANYSAPRPATDTEMRREQPALAPIAAAPEPTIVQPQIRQIPRIVDPSVADEEDGGPLFPEAPHYGEERGRKSGWLSMFGRPRHDAQPAPGPALRSTGSAQPAAQPAAARPADDPDDLEIPSFLRRLAN